jgi:ABC-type nitrate/sulfonate/bicarbonate transport system substrate-binding protein
MAVISSADRGSISPMNATKQNLSVRGGPVMVIVLAWLAASATLGPLRAAEKLGVGKAGQKVFAFAILDVGMRTGIFAKHGLDLETSEFGSGARMHQALAANSIDVGFGGGTDFPVVARGSPVKAVATVAGAPYDFGITVKAGGRIRTVAELKGSRIGVTTLSSLTAWLTGEVARQQGWTSDAITRVAVGSNTASIALLRTGEIDGFTSELGSALQVEKHGDGRVLMRFGDAVKDFYTFVLYARDSVIGNRPDALRSFLRGWFDTLAFVRANKDASIKIMAEVVGHDGDIVSELYDQLVPTYSDGRFDPIRMKGLARALKDQYGLEESALTGLYTEEFLPKP